MQPARCKLWRRAALKAPGAGVRMWVRQLPRQPVLCRRRQCADHRASTTWRWISKSVTRCCSGLPQSRLRPPLGLPGCTGHEPAGRGLRNNGAAADSERERHERAPDQGKSREYSPAAPNWLWSSILELMASHEVAYLEHCRRYVVGPALTALKQGSAREGAGYVKCSRRPCFARCLSKVWREDRKTVSWLRTNDHIDCPCGTTVYIQTDELMSTLEAVEDALIRVSRPPAALLFWD